MFATGSAQAIKKNDQVSLWFPDAAVPTLRALAPNSEFNLSLGEKDQIWHIFLHLPNQAKESIAEYGSEKQARRALWRAAEAIGGRGPKDHWWYARWGTAIGLLVFIGIMEITLATNKPENLVAGNAVSTATPGTAGYRPPGAIPMTTFGAPMAGSQPSTPASPYQTRAAIPAAPVDRTPKPQQTGLSAFGLDERTPPGGIAAIQSNSEIDSKAQLSGKNAVTNQPNSGMIDSGKKPDIVVSPPAQP